MAAKIAKETDPPFNVSERLKSRRQFQWTLPLQSPITFTILSSQTLHLLLIVLQQPSEKGVILGDTSTGKGTGSIIHQIKAQNIRIMKLADAIVNALDLKHFLKKGKNTCKYRIN